MIKNIAIIGSTGSIGTQTLQVVDQFVEQFRIKILSCHKNINLIFEQMEKYKPEYVILTDEASYNIVKKELKGNKIKLFYGIEGILKALEETEIDLAVISISGSVGIRPTLKALELGIDVALANKESIVAAGKIVKEIQKKSGAAIYPVDSEHSAIWQCLEEKSIDSLEKIILTASGGPFRKYPLEELINVTPEQALKHPNWNMGKKITIDSATLVNKGLEVIEAHWLFNVDYDKIEVVIHPQSIVHSMVMYGDGSILAHLGLPDMKIPIQYALSYPKRWINNFPKLDIKNAGNLEFFEPDFEKFTALKLAFQAGKAGGTMPAVFNAANEVAVDLFLQQQISFMEIPSLIERVLNEHQNLINFNEKDLFEVDFWARKKAGSFNKR